jgi:hypothetical protein
MSMNDEPRQRARMYAEQFGLTLTDELGSGVHGIVVATESQDQIGTLPLRSALKAYQHEVHYLRERDVYLRLKQRKVEKIRACHVPQLLRCHDEYLVIEMTIVKRPYVLDFAGAYLDKAPEFSDEVMADWRAEKIEQFGKRWPEAEAILAILETHGIFVVDVNPNNIALAD